MISLSNSIDKNKRIRLHDQWKKYPRLSAGTAVAGYDPAAREYTLAFPNNEVKFGFLESLMPEYVSDCGSGSGIDVFTLRRYISRGDPESIRNVLTALFARITYANASIECQLK